MEHIKENYEVAQDIINALKKRNCTIGQSQEILRFVSAKIIETSTVQCEENLLGGFNRI